ncbi:MAG TPA: mycofactocin-coupled SDR family oxidoreductase [Baekduia sp.]|nr:mycofactocin-coupled SDR family oxidoreductase [Baekduia sp.]
MGRFDGKVALISGAARGQGRSHAVRLAEEGADVAIFDLAGPLASPRYPMPTPDDLAETARLVSEAGGRVVSRQGDVRDREALEGLVADTVSELGPIDLVVANAGITSLGPAVDLTPAMWDEMIGINLTGAWNTVQIAMPSMIEAGRGGAIVFTSSIAGLMGMPTLAHYTASKHGLVGLMKALANELAPHNIRVNTVNPTNVGTPMLLNDFTYQNFRPDIDGPTQDDAKAAFMSYNLLQVPWMEVEDVSHAVLWLLSDEARYVTGAAIPIDCGSLAKFPA